LEEILKYVGRRIEKVKEVTLKNKKKNHESYSIVPPPMF
jgi:hypothetical protein